MFPFASTSAGVLCVSAVAALIAMLLFAPASDGGDRKVAAAADDVLRFWFEELKPQQHWTKDKDLDDRIRARFGGLHAELSKRVDEAWTADARRTLAAIVVLDQFSRNMFRGDARTFSADAAAVRLTRTAIDRGWLDQLDNEMQRMFVLMPLQHSENREDQALSVELSRRYAPGAAEWAHKHKDVVDRFGRFPHRNAWLGRQSTPEEIEFLKSPGSSFG